MASASPTVEGATADASDRPSNPEISENSKKQSTGKTKRRPRSEKRGKKSSSSSSSRFVEQQRQYYRRLLHTCQKDVNKTVKETKRLECQRLARKLKEASSDDSKLRKVESKYKAMKELPIDQIVAEVMRRLGILLLNPDINNDEGDNSTEIESNDAADSTAKAQSLYLPPLSDSGAEKVLQNKRMLECVERWNDQVTEYRRWCLRQQEGGDSRSKSSSKPGALKRHKPIPSESTSFSKSVFVQLGGTGGEDGTYYGPQDETLKKNRPGQRARKAKAEALQAKEEGRPRDRSRNWREPKAAGTRERPTRDDQSHNKHVESKTIDKAHPSWQAASQKTNTGAIVQFQGTKITF